MLRELRGLARSIAVYHLDFPKRRRGIALYRRFVGPGDLVFDIGAHTGGRVGWFRTLGARVVAVEPNPTLQRVMRLMHGGDRAVVRVPMAVSREPGRMTLHYSTGNPMLTTLAGDWVDEARTTQGFTEVTWDHADEVAVTTLDHLIAEHGLPAFAKIDVEAAEADVLSGLSQPIPALSFEFLNGQQSRAETCLEILDALGPYRYALSPAETFALPDGWTDAEGMRKRLAHIPKDIGSGDIYAALNPPRGEKPID